MKKIIYFPLTLIAVAILAGCAATKNASLTEAHSSYNSAQSNPQVTTLAALELKEAGDSLSKADRALSEGETAATVDHLAYIAKQKVAVAQETANRGQVAAWIVEQMGCNSRCVGTHGTELGHLEKYIISANPVGPVQDRPFGGKFYQKS